MTLLQSFTVAYWQILIPRIIQNFALSACFPICFSLITDGFHPKYRGRAASIYTLGLYLGVALSSLSLNICKFIGWRNTYRLVGGLSLLSCLFILLLKEPERGRFDTKAQKRASGDRDIPFF